jgi:hypothetical protein
MSTEPKSNEQIEREMFAVNTPLTAQEYQYMEYAHFGAGHLPVGGNWIGRGHHDSVRYRAYKRRFDLFGVEG